MDESKKNSCIFLDDLQDKLSQVLKNKRFLHTLGVRYTAQAMAMCFGENIFNAGLASLLHDCAKYLSDSEMLSACQKNGICISLSEHEAPSLLHAKLGAYFAQTVYGVSDKEVLSAIRWHTTGKPKMTVLEKIVFIADYIEPGRKKVKDMDLIRKNAFADLDLTMALILENTLSYLSRAGKGNVMDPHSKDAYAYYQKFR